MDPAAATIALSFFGTTEETTMVPTFLCRKIRRIVFAVSKRVGRRTGFSIRFVVANASFTKELLISTSR
ncbi:MAG: hypothetical protein QOK24_1963 [Verrucomicrobiota bacterium]